MGQRTDPPADEHRPDSLRVTAAARSAPGIGRGTPRPDDGGCLPSSLPELGSKGAPSNLCAPPAGEHCPLSPADPLDRVAFQLLLPDSDRSPAQRSKEL
jgi:hypothetical protein